MIFYLLKTLNFSVLNHKNSNLEILVQCEYDSVFHVQFVLSCKYQSVDIPRHTYRE